MVKWILFVYFFWGGNVYQNGQREHEFATKAACFEALEVVRFHTSQGAADNEWLGVAWCAPKPTSPAPAAPWCAAGRRW